MTGAASTEEPAAQAPRWVRALHTPLRDLLRGRLTVRFNIDRMIDAADVPDPIAALVRTVIRRSRLWHTEKEDVAAELITHFRDGLEAEASADELVTFFGDPGRAARLIRRAKRRNRPAAWHALRYTSVGLVALVLLYIGYGLYFLTGTPNPSVDYLQWVNAQALAVPQEDRAWPIYRAALLRLDPLPELEGFSRPPMPGEEGWEVMAEYVRKQAGALALARQAAQRPALGFVVGCELSPEDRKLWPDAKVDWRETADGALVGVSLLHLAALRELSWALALDAYRAAGAGDGNTILGNLSALPAIARHVREAPRLCICNLTALSIMGIASGTLADILGRWPEVLTDEQLQRLAHLFAATDDVFRLRVDHERLVFYDLVQRIYTDDGAGDGRITLSGFRVMNDVFRHRAWSGEWKYPLSDDALPMLARPALSLISLSREGVIDAHARVMDMWEAEASRPLWETGVSPVESQASAWRESQIQRGRHLLLHLWWIEFGRLHVQAERVLCFRDALLVAVALELYHRRHGGWPPSLDVLVPALLPGVPPDRFDGRPLRYALIDGEPVVYSVGTDRDDDGGRPPRYADGRPNYDGAREWIPPQQLRCEARLDRLNDGDWILWPRPIKPLVRAGPWHSGIWNSKH